MPDNRDKIAETKLMQEQAKEFTKLQQKADLFNASQVERARLTRYVASQVKAGAMDANEAARAMEHISTFTDSANMHSQRLAKTLNVNSLSWKNVSEAIANAALKVGLWMIATSAVMGATRKLAEVIQLWKDLQVTLERIGITTSTAGRQLSDYFDIAASAAIKMGMPIQDTLKGLDLTLRATASLRDQATRTATAELMLRDAAILGNVAGMSFAQATDILVGSLKQTGMSLDQGIVLLDKWVAVAKTAQVSINDLSQGFAIMASAAEDAGVSVDQVNGIIAALSETVTLGPIEVGNAVRALMSTLYNPGSIATLRKFGVAVEDATGNFRSFWDIMSELSSMQLTGALSETQLLEIAKAAGAGQRRYAQFIALLKNWQTALRTSQVSAGAFGDALTANERIVNTLTNAWDQFTAAQNKMWYNLGSKSGIIDDMTKSFQALANIFSTLGNMSSPIAVMIKLVAELTAAFVALKVAEVALIKTGAAAAIGAWGAKALASAKNLRLLAGFGGAASALAGNVIQPNLIQSVTAPKGGMSMGGQTIAGGRVTSLYMGRGAEVQPPMVTSLTRGEIAGQAWANLGTKLKSSLQGAVTAMTTPMRGLGLVFGTLAAGTIMKELTHSNWAGIGGGIGAAIGGFLGGPAGMAVGTLIGGTIAFAIEDATRSFEEKVALERERWRKQLPDAVVNALSKAQDQIDLSKTLLVPINQLKEDQLEVIQKEIDVQRAALAASEKSIAAARSFTPGDILKTGPAQTLWAGFQKIRSRGWEVEAQAQRENIDKLVAAQRVLNDATKSQATIYDEIAARTQTIRNELGLEIASNEQINAIKAKSLQLTSKELQEQLSLASSAPLTYAKILSQLELVEAKIPGITAQFKKMVPSYEAFTKLEPESYAPLVDVLGTIVSSMQAMRDDETAVAVGQKRLNELIAVSPEISDVIGIKGTVADIDNLTKLWKYWSDVQTEAIRGMSLEPFYKGWGISMKDGSKAAEVATAFLNQIVNQLGAAKDASVDLLKTQSDYNTALAITSERVKYIGGYKAPGQLEFFDVGYQGLDRLGELIEKYGVMFDDYTDSEKQIFHAFIKDEQGVVQDILGTFVGTPEAWQAALTELRGINDNTAKMTEAQYNIPSQYAVPSRYWYYKTTGSTEFGPTQDDLWARWQKFVQSTKEGTDKAINDSLKDTGTDAVKGAASSYVDNLTKSLTDTLINRLTTEDFAAVAQAMDEALAFKRTPMTTPKPTTMQEYQSQFEVYQQGGGLRTYNEWLRLFMTNRSRQGGGDIPETGPYYLHSGENVSSTESISKVSNILSGSYQVLLASQNYLAQINSGISALRSEVAALRKSTSTVATKNDMFPLISNSGMGGDIPTFGSKGVL